MNALDLPRAMAKIAQLENENHCLKRETTDLKEQIEKAQEAYKTVKKQLDDLRGCFKLKF